MSASSYVQFDAGKKDYGIQFSCLLYCSITQFALYWREWRIVERDFDRNMHSSSASDRRAGGRSAGTNIVSQNAPALSILISATPNCPASERLAFHNHPQLELRALSSICFSHLHAYLAGHWHSSAIMEHRHAVGKSCVHRISADYLSFLM